MNSRRQSEGLCGKSRFRAALAGRVILWVLIILWVGVGTLCAGDWSPSERFLDLVRGIESSDGVFVVGDHGNSRGAYQLSAAAWQDVSAWRAARKFACFDYETHVWDESVSRIYASNYLQILHDRLAKHLKRSPTSGEVYAAYNMGFSAYARCEFSLARVNRITASNCRHINSVLHETEEEADPQGAVSVTLAARD